MRLKGRHAIIRAVMSGAAASLRSVHVQLPVLLVSLGHGATHWIAATFYLVLPFIAGDLGLSYVQAGVLVTCFHVGSTLANFPSGMLVDLTGKRVAIQAAALVLGSLALFGVGAVDAYLALCAVVVVLGASNMLWHPAAISYLSQHLPNNRGYALSIHALGANLGDAVAPVVAGWMLLTLSWHATAELNALSGIAAAAAIAIVLARSDRASQPVSKAIDWRGYGRSLWETLKRRDIWSLCLMSGFRTMSQSGLLVFLPLFLANEMKVDPFTMGITLMLLQLGGVVATPIAGVLSDRIGRRPIVMGGIFATTILVFALPFIGNTTIFVIAVAILGFFMYAVRPVIHSWMMDRAPSHLAASLTSTLFGTQSLLSMIGPVIGGWLADRYGLGSVFYFLAGLVLIANLFALAVPRSEKGD
jgi:MFS family permease